MLVGLALVLLATGCRNPQPPKAAAPDTVAHTAFTERIENYFEHDPLTAGRPSRFLIHLTDLSDGAPVEQADVTLQVRAAGGSTPPATKARVGRVTGIYVAEVTPPAPGTYSIEFRVKNAKLDERMALDGFTVR